MNRRDFYFDLPPSLIAQEPAKERSGSRLMVVERKTGAVMHKRFFEIASFLSPGDCLVLNDSRVIPARLMGTTETGATIEVLLHERVNEKRWHVLCKPGRKAKTGVMIRFGGGVLSAMVKEVNDDGLRVVDFEYEGIFDPLLEQIGEMPLPHYIKPSITDDEVKERYQTVYAKHDGSVAAPTAGLHFTDELLSAIEAMGVRIARVTLHVGLGTFRPVKTDIITEHTMHREYCRIEPDQAVIINETKLNGGRVIAVGTTSCRTLESRTEEAGKVLAGTGHTDIFIYPGYTFKMIDALITNFHLPESTLLMLVSALAGRENILRAYDEAIREKYRFYSFGDAMLIL